MAIHELPAMTWEEIAALDCPRAVAILPVGATEAHGPHLPVATDVLIAEAMARAGAERLSARGVDALILPPLAYTPAPFAAGFAGTIGISPSALSSTVAGIAMALARLGIRWLVIANAHLDPAHLGALHAAADVDADAGGDRGLRILFPDITRRPWGARLTEEFRSGACHAGQYETSIIMAVRPDLVRPVRSTLAAVPHSLSVAMREGRHTFEEAGGDRAYFGDPAAATAEEGRATIAILGGIVEEMVMQAITDDAEGVSL
jgi:creatinine amidohydrolase